MARSSTRFLLAALLAGGSTNCLLDTGPINMPPTVQIAEPDQSLYRGQPVTFMATIHDPDQGTDSLNVVWYIGADCNQAAAGNPANCASQSKDQCSYSPPELGSVCVVVRVTDRYGAKAEARRAFSVEDRPPTAIIEQTSPTTAAKLPLGSTLTFASKSTDPDAADRKDLTCDWTVTGPDGGSLSCSSSSAPDQCSFTAASPGTYSIQLIATDPSGMDSAPATVYVVIDQDQPPCIVGFKPEELSTFFFANASNALIVYSVLDDMDPYPGSTQGTFSWSYRKGTSGPFQRGRLPDNSYRLDIGPGWFAAGDVVQIRVVYQDRINRDHDLSSCDQNAERCTLVPDCAQWVTWTVVFL